MDDPVSAISFPRADSNFCRAVAVEISRLELSGGARPSDLVEALRDRYPGVVAVPRDHLADLMPRPGRIWYVYRDGNLLDSRRAVAMPVVPEASPLGTTSLQRARRRSSSLTDSRT